MPGTRFHFAQGIFHPASQTAWHEVVLANPLLLIQDDALVFSKPLRHPRSRLQFTNLLHHILDLLHQLDRLGVIVHGVIVKEVTAIPLSRIQHVDTRQGILEQWFGLARLSIYTASGMGADGFIPGLTSEMADALRDRLVRDDGDDGV